MRARTLLRYLIGDRQAILDLAADRGSLWIGLLFVLSAGLAREYDGEDLLHEPWYLLIPIGASLVASFVLFLVAFGRLFLSREPHPKFFEAYRSFLTLFWMTAPLAWLYAVPYERFLSPGDATRANLWTLALVAAWRVLLMVRVVSVLSGRSLVASFFVVMAFADAVALVAVSQMPHPVISFMGGIRVSESERIISNATLMVWMLGLLSAPVWGIGLLAVLAGTRPTWRASTVTTDAVSGSRGLLRFAIASLAVGLFILPYAQGEQIRRSRVERDMRTGRIAEGIDFMSAHAKTDFPPLWDPPPRVGYGETTPGLYDVMDVLVERNHAPWVHAHYVEKFRQSLGGEYGYFQLSEEQLARLARILPRLPEGAAIAAQYKEQFEQKLYTSQPGATNDEHLATILRLNPKESSMTRDQASAFAKLALKGLRREYPNKPEHVLSGLEDVQSPKALHPAFYGCFDWHSSVHGHWMLAKLLRTFPDLPEAKEIRSVFNEHLTAENLKREAAYFHRPESKSFERPYGWAWLLKLAEELHGWPDADAKLWRENLQPLTDTIVARYLDYFPKQTYPIRSGVHSNTAFGLAFAHDYAKATDHAKLQALVEERARFYYANDTDAPARWEPGGADFFSPTLMEADLMRRALPAAEFVKWFDRFLPPTVAEPRSLLEPATVTDRSDPQLVHLDGLNLSRAFCMRNVARALPADHPARKRLADSAMKHEVAGLKHVASGEYAGEHWLASFAVLLLTTTR